MVSEDLIKLKKHLIRCIKKMGGAYKWAAVDRNGEAFVYVRRPEATVKVEDAPRLHNKWRTMFGYDYAPVELPIGMTDFLDKNPDTWVSTLVHADDCPEMPGVAKLQNDLKELLRINRELFGYKLHDCIMTYNSWGGLGVYMGCKLEKGIPVDCQSGAIKLGDVSLEDYGISKDQLTSWSDIYIEIED